MSTDTPHEPGSRRKKPGLHDLFRNGIESARQLMQPRAFRIAAPDACGGHRPSETSANEPSASGDNCSSADEKLIVAMKALAAVATAVWRAKTKLDTEAQVELPAELRNVPRHVQAAWDALVAGQVQVEDPAGQKYVPGMAVNPLTIQPLEGIGSEVIHETIKPSVYFNNTLIQRADVIVGRPITESDKPQESEAIVQEELLSDTHAPEQKGNEADGPDND